MEQVRTYLQHHHQGQEIHDLPELATHQVVLGRYLNSKTKPLNEATRIYRDVRKNTKRTKHFRSNEINSLKQLCSERLSSQLKQPNLPQVQFVVDAHKAQEAGKLTLTTAADNSCLVQRTEGSDTIVFLLDVNDHFLKADLDSKKRPGKGPTADPNNTNSCKKRKQSSECHCLPRSVTTTTTVRTDTSSLSEKSTSPKQPTTTTPATPSFQLQLMPTNSTLLQLEEQAHRICQNWIQETNGLEAMLRKARLVQSFRFHIRHFKQRILLQNNLFQDSPIPALQQLQAQQFILILNTLGNSMVQWYQLHPNNCLEGETNAWTGIHAQEEEEDDDVPFWNSDADMEQGSIGTYSSLELDLPSTLATDDGLSDIVQCFEEFSMNSSTATAPMAVGSGEWSPVVREQEDIQRNNTPKQQLPPRWKRQPGHQFLQKQLRRFRTKRSSPKTKNKVVATAPSVVRVRTKEELSLLYRRLRHNDPLLKEAVLNFDIAQQEAQELIRVLGLSFYDWDMRRHTNHSINTAFIVLKRSENSDWEEGSK